MDRYAGNRIHPGIRRRRQCRRDSNSSPAVPWPRFTLVELLVVTVIMALLAGLLLPALARAKENGRRALCLSNLKQTGTSITLYADENDGHVPPNRFLEWSSPVIWDGALGSAVGVGLALRNKDAAETAFCPSAVGRTRDGPQGLACWGSVTGNSVYSSYHYRCAAFGASIRLSENRSTPGLVLDDQVLNARVFCHQWKYVNILFFDGSVRGCRDPGGMFVHDGGPLTLPACFRHADAVY